MAIDCAGDLASLAGASWQSAQVGVGGLGGPDADPAVDGLDTVGAGNDGTQLELGDLRQVIGHPGDPQQQIPQGGEVGGRNPAAPEQQRPARADRIRSSASDSVKGASRAARSASTSPRAAKPEQRRGRHLPCSMPTALTPRR